MARSVQHMRYVAEMQFIARAFRLTLLSMPLDVEIGCNGHHGAQTCNAMEVEVMIPVLDRIEPLQTWNAVCGT